MPYARTLTVAALIALALPATPASAAPLVPAGQAVIRSGQLAVTVDKAFPRVLGYTTPAGAQLGGSTTTTGNVRINGIDQKPTVTASMTGSAARYQLSLPKVTIRTELSVAGQ